MLRVPAVYIMTNRVRGTLYIGVTSDLPARVWHHKNDCVPSFTSRHGLHRLVYYEGHDSMEGAIIREKRLKKWNREWKIRLIEERNPTWRDLFKEIC